MHRLGGGVGGPGTMRTNREEVSYITRDRVTFRDTPRGAHPSPGFCVPYSGTLPEPSDLIRLDVVRQYLTLSDIWSDGMPNVHLTASMEAYVQGQLKSGSYANVSEVVRAGLRMLMERDGARQFYALKSELEGALREAEAGEFAEFDPATYEPEAFPG